MANKIKPYKKNGNFSYTSGAFATIELLKTKPEILNQVYYHSRYQNADLLRSLCADCGIPCLPSDQVFRTAGQKDNSYVLGVFNQYASQLRSDRPHIVLVNPADMGNLGTIIRTAVGFHIHDMAIIEPAADLWNPKTVRASMGAIFHIRHQTFDCFSDYQQSFPFHSIFPFMLSGKLTPAEAPAQPLFSLVFGNEASGLDNLFFSQFSQTICIPLSASIDSFNLSVAVAIGAYEFSKKNHLF